MPEMEWIRKIFEFYREGFQGMTLGRKLWILIGIKLAIMFLILKLLFFPDFLKSHFTSDKEKSNYVLEQLTKRK
jgi:hypothetical protein